MITLMPFNKEYTSTLNAWLEYYGEPLVTVKDLPEIGYQADLNGKMVAVAFIRRCEGNIAILDSLCTNPIKSSQVRHEAIDLLVNKIIWKCEELKLKSLFAFTVNKGILERSEKHGFVESKHIVISREVS